MHYTQCTVTSDTLVCCVGGIFRLVAFGLLPQRLELQALHVFAAFCSKEWHMSLE